MSSTTTDQRPGPALADRVEIWPIDRLAPYEKNPRKNNSVVDQMCASIEEFGFKIPVLARTDGEVVDGHLRLKAAKKLGIAEVPVIRRMDASAGQGVPNHGEPISLLGRLG